LDTGYLASEVDGFDDPNAGDGEQGGDGDGNDSGTTNFHTYEEPDLDNPSIDVDIDAVAQFIAHHTTTEEEEGESLKIPTDTMITVFTEWAEMNSVDLEKLDPSATDSVRKGNLTQILGGSFEIEKSQLRIDGDQTMCYHPIALSEDIRSIIE